MTVTAFLRLWRWGNAVCCLGVLQFVACVGLAMLCYPGGSVADRHSPGYAIFGNFLSDLGRETAWCGRPNGASCRLFNISIVLLGLATAPFFLFLPLHAPDRAALLGVAAALGVVSACGLIGIGLTPYDRYLEAHLRALAWWLVPFWIAVVIHSLALLLSEECHGVFPLLSMGLAVLIGVYALQGIDVGLHLVLNGQPEATLSALTTSVAGQKYVAAASIAWYAVFSARMLFRVEKQSREEFSPRK
jgi:hypothetical membrane protein